MEKKKKDLPFLPYLQIYPGDFLERGCFFDASPKVRGVLFSLVLYYWGAGCELPSDPCKLARRCNCTESEMREAIKQLENDFLIMDGDSIDFPELEEQYESALTKSQRYSEGAKKGWKKRRKKKEKGGNGNDG